MAITYTWSVTGIKVATQNSNTNAVVQTYWKKIGTDEHGNVYHIGASEEVEVKEEQT